MKIALCSKHASVQTPPPAVADFIDTAAFQDGNEPCPYCAFQSAERWAAIGLRRPEEPKK